MKKDKNKKYLLRKKSGSRNHTKINWRNYERTLKNENFLEPEVEEKIETKSSCVTKNKNGIDTSLVNKWLYSQIGNHFDDIYSEFLDRIQAKYKDQYKECIFWYAKKSNEIYIENEIVYLKHTPYCKITTVISGFYFHPETNILCRIEDKVKKTVTKKEGKKKYAEFKKQRNQSNSLHKSIQEELVEKAELIMKEKKKIIKF